MHVPLVSRMGAMASSAASNVTQLPSTAMMQFPAHIPPGNCAGCSNIPCCLVTQQKIKHQQQRFDLLRTSEVCPCPCPDTRQRHCAVLQGEQGAKEAQHQASGEVVGALPGAMGHGETRCRIARTHCQRGELPRRMLSGAEKRLPGAWHTCTVPTHSNVLLHSGGRCRAGPKPQGPQGVKSEVP